MSLLLDALRKSEAQRRRGRAPALELGPMPDGSRSARSGRRWPLWLVAIAAVAVLVWQWPTIADFVERWRSTPSSTLADAEPERQGSEDSTVAGVVPAVTSQAPGAALDAVAPAESAPGDAPAGQAPLAEAAYEAADREPEPAATRDGSQQRQAAARQQRAEAMARAVERARQAAAEPATDSASESAATTAEPQGSAQPVAQQAPPASEQAEEADTAGHIRPWELPQGLRAEFPELDLTVHFYAELPGERFVLINGERYRQGDRVDDQVRIREILRRGAVVEFGNYLVLVE